MPFVKGCVWTDRQKEECGFKKGVIPWNKGKTNIYSKETLEAMSLTHKGKPSCFKGRKHSLESIMKLKEVSKNQLNKKGAKGKPWSMARRLAQEKRNGLPYKVSIRPKRIHLKSLIKNGKEYPYDWHEKRKQVYQRDGWICQECGVHCHNDKKIQCHHINYNLTNNAFSNLITLCVSCHAKTNFKRKDWENHYEKIMKGRGLIISEN